MGKMGVNAEFKARRLLRQLHLGRKREGQICVCDKEQV